MVKVAKVEDPPYGDSKMLKLLNSIKVHHIRVDDPNIALYVKEVEESLSCYYARNLAPSTIETKKVLYMYLEGLLNTKIISILDMFCITYEPMEQRIA